MIDVELTNFYNSVKSESWPEIQNYVDFIKLPAHIKQECYDVYDLKQKKEDICDRNYWINLTTIVYIYKNLAFVPVYKCASTHYITIFQKLGWQETTLASIDKKQFNFFGVVLHPVQRHFKGITEMVINSYRPSTTVLREFPIPDYQKMEEDLKTSSLRHLIANIFVGDELTTPYDSMFGDLLYDINWIPLDLLSIVEQAHAIKNFCKMHGHDIDIPVQYKIHESSQKQLDIYNTIIDICSENDGYNYRLYKLFDHDLKLFYNLLDTFSVDWSHIVLAP